MAVGNNPQQAEFNHALFVKETADALLEKNVVFSELKSRGRILFNQGGTQIEQRVRNARNTIQGFGPMFESVPAQPQLLTHATYSWGGFYADYYIDEWDVLANKGESKILDHQDKLLQFLKEDWMEVMEDYMFTNGLTEDPAKIGGFAAFIKTTGTYAGLSQTNTYWKAQITNMVSGSWGTTPLQTLTKLENLCTRGSGNTRPHAGFMTRTAWNTVHDKIETIRRIVENPDKVKVGHRNFVNNGVEYFWSDSAPVDKVWVVNFDTLYLRCQTSKLFEERTVETFSPIGQLHQMYSKCQLCCDNPRMNGVVSASTIN